MLPMEGACSENGSGKDIIRSFKILTKRKEMLADHTKGRNKIKKFTKRQ